jgi:hypothetical protein
MVKAIVSEREIAHVLVEGFLLCTIEKRAWVCPEMNPKGIVCECSWAPLAGGGILVTKSIVTATNKLAILWGETSVPL